MRSIIVVAALLGSSAQAEPLVLLFPTIGTPEHVSFSGRVLKHRSTTGSSLFSKNLRRLTASSWEGALVEVRYAERVVKVTSGEDGNFSVTVSSGEMPFTVGLSTAEAKVKGAATGISTVDIISTEAPFVVISDFDDTLAVTNVVKTRKLLKAALMQDEHSQPVVEGMAEFLNCLQEGKRARPGFALVSGSPLQYVERINAFLKTHRFPAFGLYLRDVGPSTLRNYKQPILRSLLQAVPNDVILVGDSGEHDPEVYRQIRAEFPGRIKAIYIRNAGNADDAARFEDTHLFVQPREAALDAVKRGFASASCVDKAFSVEESK